MTPNYCVCEVEEAREGEPGQTCMTCGKYIMTKADWRGVDQNIREQEKMDGED